MVENSDLGQFGRDTHPLGDLAGDQKLDGDIASSVGVASLIDLRLTRP